MSNNERIQLNTVRLEDMIRQIITAGGFVFTETDQSISGLKTFSKIGLTNADGNVYYLKRDGNSFVITNADETPILSVDTTANRLYAFDREIAFKDEASGESYDDTDLRNADTALSDRIKNAITNVSHTSGTGEFTFTREDGTTFTVNTLLEKVVTNFTYNETTQNLELTLEDGTIKSIPMTAFIDDYVGVDGEIITITISNDNKISATIKNGTITKEHLSETVQATLNEVSTNSGKIDSVLNNLDSKVSKVEGKGLSTNDYTTVEKTKLEGLSNYNDSELRGLIDGKVSKVTGKGLSTNDYTTAEKEKLAGLNNYNDSELVAIVNNKLDSYAEGDKSIAIGGQGSTESTTLSTSSDGVLNIYQVKSGGETIEAKRSTWTSTGFKFINLYGGESVRPMINDTEEMAYLSDVPKITYDPDTKTLTITTE